MSKMVQIRHVPEPIHQVLKARAARAGLSLSDYLLGELRTIVERPTLEEIFERISHRSPVNLTESAADTIRAERDAR